MSLDSTFARLDEVEASAASLARDISAALTAIGTVDGSDPKKSAAFLELIALGNAWGFFYAGPRDVGKSGWREYYEARRALLLKAITIIRAAKDNTAAVVVLISWLLPGFTGIAAFDLSTQSDIEEYAARLRELYADFARIGGTATAEAPKKPSVEDPKTLGKLGAALAQEAAKQTKSALDTGRIIAFAALAIGAVYVVREVRK